MARRRDIEAAHAQAGAQPDPRSRTDGPIGTPTGPTGMKDTDLPEKGANLTERQKARNRRQVADWELEVAKAELARLKAAGEDTLNPSVYATAAQIVRDREGAANGAANEEQQQVDAETKPGRVPAGADAGFTDEVVETGAGKRRIRRYFKWDGYGNKVPDTARGDKGLEDLGSAESATDVATAGVGLQTAQVNLQRLQQQMAEEQDPQQEAPAGRAGAAGRAGPRAGPGQGAASTCRPSELNLRTAQQKLEEATSPEAKERAQSSWSWRSSSWSGPKQRAGPGRPPPGHPLGHDLPRHHHPRPQHRGDQHPAQPRLPGAHLHRRHRRLQRPGAPAAAGRPHRARPAPRAAAPGGHLRGGRGEAVHAVVRRQRGDAPGRLPRRRRGGPAQGAAGERGPAAGRERQGGGPQPPARAARARGGAEGHAAARWRSRPQIGRRSFCTSSGRPLRA